MTTENFSQKLVKLYLIRMFMGFIAVGTIVSLVGVFAVLSTWGSGVPYKSSPSIVIGKYKEQKGKIRSNKVVVVYPYDVTDVMTYLSPEEYAQRMASKVSRYNVDLAEMDRLKKDLVPITEHATTQYFQSELNASRSLYNSVKRGYEGRVYYRANYPWAVFNSSTESRMTTLKIPGMGLLLLIFGIAGRKFVKNNVY